MEDDWIDPLQSTAAPAPVSAAPSLEKPADDWGAAPSLEKPADDWGAAPSLAAAPYPAMVEPKPEQKEEPTGVLGTVSTAISNVPESAMKFAEDIVYPILHPVQTAESLGSLALGLTQKLIPGEQEQEKYADALGQALYDRYGTLENVKKTFMYDPIGMLSDVSGIVSGGTLLAGKVGKAAAKTAYSTPALAAYETVKSAFSDAPSSIQNTVGVASDIAKQGPLYFPKKAAEATIAVSNQLAGFKSGVGPDALVAVYRAGREGGPRLEAFKRSFRDLEPMSDIVPELKSVLFKMHKNAGAEYLRDLGRLDLESKVLDFDKIDDAVKSGIDMQRFKGEGLKLDEELTAQNKMLAKIEKWKNLDPKEYHTPAGMDFLKKQLWDSVENYQPGTVEHKIAKDIYESVRSTIIKEVPEYAPVMKAYEESMELLKEIERSLSLGKRATADTALRKLQSVLRNNVNSSYGYRKNLAEFLVQNGSPFLMEKLAGQALNPIAARGMARFSTDIALTTMGLAGAITTNPLAVGMMAPIIASSPRAMGNLFMLAGIADRYASKIPKPKLVEQSLVQSGRFAQEAEPLVGSQTEEYPTEEEGSVFDKMQRARGGKIERPFARAEGGYLPSEDYLAAMRKSESFKPKAYWDVKQYSIGYGTKANSPDEKISQEEALRRFYQEVTPAAAMVNRFAPDAPEGVKAALTSLTYNTGSKWMESGLGKAIKDSDYDKARQIFLKYTKADGKELEGLKRRRESEAQWFGSPAISAGGVSPEAYEALDATYREQTEQPKTDQDKLDALIAEIVRTPEAQPMAPMAPIQAPPRATVPTVMPYSRAHGGSVTEKMLRRRTH